MKAYSYDYQGLLIGEIECDLCQITELKKLEQSSRGLKEGEEEIQSIPLIPNYSTLIAPKNIEGHNAFFIEGEWLYKEIQKPEPKKEPKKIELTYAEKRIAEYPSALDYLDGVVKSHSEDQAVHDNGVAQVEKYIKECLAVKAKYPKSKK